MTKTPPNNPLDPRLNAPEPPRLNEITPASTFTYLNPHTRLLEVVDVVTGKPIAIQRSMEDIATHHKEMLIPHQMPDGEIIYLEKGLNPDFVAHGSSYKVNKVAVEIICQKILEGESLTNICKQPGMPSYAVFARWRKENDWIKEMLAQARLDRAESLRDMLLDEALKADEDNVQSSRLRVETLKWLAGKDDPARYEAKQDKLSVNVTPSVIMVSTGINREVNHGEREAEAAHNHIKIGGSAAEDTGSGEQQILTTSSSGE